MKIEFELDGTPVAVDTNPARPLRDVLREEFGKTGVKSGCQSGACGVCTVHVNGEAVKSCLHLVGKVDGTSVTTIDGLTGDDESLHAVQQAFHDHFASQCGYCTPGFVMAVAAFVERMADEESVDRESIRAGLKGNLCRCTGYEKIVDAVEECIERKRESQPEAE